MVSSSLLLLPLLVPMVMAKYLLLETEDQEGLEDPSREGDYVGTCDILCLRPPYSHPQCCPICGLGCRRRCGDTCLE